MCRGGLAAAQLGPYARTEAQAAVLRAAGAGRPSTRAGPSTEGSASRRRTTSEGALVRPPSLVRIPARAATRCLHARRFRSVHLERHLDWWVRSGGGSPAG
jgi:hypothetical protein